MNMPIWKVTKLFKLIDESGNQTKLLTGENNKTHTLIAHQCNEYEEDGVYIKGDLVVVDFINIVNRTNNIDLIDACKLAEAMAAQIYPKYKAVLHHPKLVLKRYIL